ncbi:MAG: transposase, partial [Candidatus Aminicenantes bacterium]|nr:transposase [Candidatus Aminicenantes bacterium]
KELQRRSWNRNRQWTKYRIDKDQCASCELKSQCTNDKNGRSINRLPGDDLIKAGRQDAASEEGKKDLKRRQHLMERSYAYGKRFGYKRARWRALWRVSIQQLLVATVQNLKKISQYGKLNVKAEEMVIPIGNQWRILCRNFFYRCRVTLSTLNLRLRSEY